VPDLSKILDLAGPKALGLFIALAIIKWLHIRGLLSLSEIHPAAPTFNDVAAILSGVLAVMWLIENALRRIYQFLCSRRRRRVIRCYLTSLSADEEDLLRTMVYDNEQSVTLNMAEPLAQRLSQKGLLRPAPGAGNPLHWNYTAPPVAWTEMQRLWFTDGMQGVIDRLQRGREQRSDL
jgi:hypothetical protein